MSAPLRCRFVSYPSLLASLPLLTLVCSLSLSFIETQASGGAYADALKELEDVEEFVMHSITIGAILHMRDLFTSTRRAVTQDRVPGVADFLVTLSEQYDVNVLGQPDLLKSDALAYDAGHSEALVDHAMRVTVGSMVRTPADRDRFRLLPHMYAATFTLSDWRHAHYHMSVGAHANNVHCMARCAYQLIVTTASIPVGDDEYDEAAVGEGLSLFVQAASSIIATLHEEAALPDFKSLIIFVDKCREVGELLSSSIVEPWFPYALIRATYGTLRSYLHAPLPTDTPPPRD